MSYSRIDDFTPAVERAAQAWPEVRVVTQRPTTSYSRFRKASELLMRDLVMEEPLSGGQLIEQPAEFGMRVKFRLCYIASLLAALDGASVNELSDAIQQQNTWRLLNGLMGTTSVIANHAEESMGILPTDMPIELIDLREWSLDADGLFYNQLGKALKEARDKSPGEKKLGMCPLKRMAVEKRLMLAAVNISTQDRNLSPRTLSERAEIQAAYAR